MHKGPRPTGRRRRRRGGGRRGCRPPSGSARGIAAGQERGHGAEPAGETQREGVIGVGQRAVDVEAQRANSCVVEPLAHWTAAGKGIAWRKASAKGSSGARIQRVWI